MAQGNGQTIEAVPAYGADYNSKKAVMEAWNAGKDFKDAFSGSYLNKEDADNQDLSVMVRYAKLLKVMVVR